MATTELIMLWVKVDHSKLQVDASGGRESDLEVIDFDWADEASVVRCPLQRRSNISWPNKAVETIGVGDTKRLFDWWF